MMQSAEVEGQQPKTVSRIEVEGIKKTKKTEGKYFKALCQIDREAFDKHGDSGMIVKTFWKS